MSSYLVDANVWLALLVEPHEHHPLARRWFRTLAPGEAGLCRLAQLSVIRLMGTARVMQGEPVSPTKAWGAVQELLDDERVVFLHEPERIDEVWPTLFRYPSATPGLVNDSYLAAFAIASGRSMMTSDRGFQQFRGLDLEILAG